MKPEFLSALHRLEKEILSRTQQLFHLAESTASFEEVLDGYQEVVDLVGQKYALYRAELASDRQNTTAQKQKKAEELESQYSAEIAHLAVVIDRIRGTDIQ